MSEYVIISYPPLEFKGPQTTWANMTAAVGIGLPAGANALLVQATVQDVRITFDGQPPTATHGYQLRAGDPAVIVVLMAGGSLQAIQATSGALLEVIGVSIPQ